MTGLGLSGRAQRPVLPFGAYLPDGDGPALCRRFCSRLKAGAEPLPRGSAAGLVLCRRYCRTFARGASMTVVRRPRGTEGAQ